MLMIWMFVYLLIDLLLWLLLMMLIGEVLFDRKRFGDGKRFELFHLLRSEGRIDLVSNRWNLLEIRRRWLEGLAAKCQHSLTLPLSFSLSFSLSLPEVPSGTMY